jgi:ATP-dependent Clp protease ATP-binding subunit ClpX
MLNVPFFVGDATGLTQAGYVGNDVETLLQGLIQEAQGDIQRAEWGIIFLDEIDKIARKGGRDRAGYRDVTGEGVQQSLLKLLEGSKVNVPRTGKAGTMTAYDTIDTTNILFICAGSFAGIEPIVEARINKGSRLGFGASAREKIDQTKTYLSTTEEDLLEFGIIPEMMGRLAVLTTTVELTEEDMIRVLSEPRNSIIKQFKALFQMDGVNLDFEPEALRAIAKEAKTRPTGARALRSIVESTLRQLSYDLPGDTRTERVLITEQTLKTGQAVHTLRDENLEQEVKQA